MNIFSSYIHVQEWIPIGERSYFISGIIVLNERNTWTRTSEHIYLAPLAFASISFCIHTILLLLLVYTPTISSSTLPYSGLFPNEKQLPMEPWLSYVVIIFGLLILTFKWNSLSNICTVGLVFFPDNRIDNTNTIIHDNGILLVKFEALLSVIELPNMCVFEYYCKHSVVSAVVIQKLNFCLCRLRNIYHLFSPMPTHLVHDLMLEP